MQTISNSVVSEEIRKQIDHWTNAAIRLSHLEDSASQFAWSGVDNSTALLIKTSLKDSIQKLLEYCSIVKGQLKIHSSNKTKMLSDLYRLKGMYTQTENTLHFYTVALNSRTNPKISSLLRACDYLCIKSMEEILPQLGYKTPRVLTYIDKGLGASILKAGQKLWDGSVSTVAAVKVTQHNLLSPTAIIHETGHQIAHILDLNQELAHNFAKDIKSNNKNVAEAFSGWASEIIADAFAFANTGFASVWSLNNVVSGKPSSLFAYHFGDPHPISYIRQLLGIEMCTAFYGKGPCDNLKEYFLEVNNINESDIPHKQLIIDCVKVLPQIVEIIFKKPYKSFKSRTFINLIDPIKVSPIELLKLESKAGSSLYTSHAWIWKECLKILALNGYKMATSQKDLREEYDNQEKFMIKLGYSINLN
ncbi:hypothetical protein BH10BAC5_BH10BAC5_12460 [soil metagenome]